MRSVLQSLLVTLVLMTEPAAAAQEIVRQRLPDGRVVFTDRPVPGATIEKRWSVEPEDPVAAQARREALARESAAVSERLTRNAAAQREADLQAELARERAARDAAEREAARARAEAAEQAAPRAIVWPALRPRPQPAPVGITPPPPRERAIDRLIPTRRPPAPAAERDR
jgi:flagellar biosynthesis GTPase FlhF